MKTFPECVLQKKFFSFEKTSFLRLFGNALLLLYFLASLEPCKAQGIDRESLTSESAVVHGSDSDEPYNIAAGPLNLRMGSSLAASFNDNINVSQTDRLADLIIQPAVDIAGRWQATELNALTFDLGIGYQDYVFHEEASGLIISPSSGTQFNIFIGDVKVNLHDDFSFQQDPTQVGQLSQISQFPRFLNTAGIQADWDLNDIIPSVGYDHSNFLVLDSAFQYLSYQSDTLSPKITFNLGKTIQTGIEATISSMRYIQNIQNNNFSTTAGSFVTTQISGNLSLSAHAGGILTRYDTGGLNGDNENLLSWYANIGVTHRINDVLVESLTAGKEYLPGLTSNFTQRVYVNYTPSWQATSYLNVSSNLWYENLDDSQAVFRQESNRYGASLQAAWSATPKTTISFSYQYVLKDAEVANLGYYQNQATVALNYQF